MIVIAHRGASGYAPEHTFASWDRAAAMGADYLEQDLQMTRDGVLVVMHDETLDRTIRRNGAPCTGRVIDHDLADLQSCDAGSWFAPEFTSERVPTLDEVLKRYPDANFYIETKKPEEAPGMEDKLLDLLDRHGLIEPARRDWRVLVQSFSETSLRKMAGLVPGLPLIQLLHRDTLTSDLHSVEAMFDGIARYAVGIGPSHHDLTPAVIEAAHARCLHVHPYTVDDAARMDALTEMGVDGMFTNFPDRLLARRPPSEARGIAATRLAAASSRQCRESVQGI